MSYLPARNMSCAAIDVKPRWYDWSDGYDEEHGECWQSAQADRRGTCGKIVVADGEGQHRDFDHDSRCEGYLSTSGPAMSYFYALPGFNYQCGDMEMAARRINDLALCVVRFPNNPDDEEYALALTGGGMDMSWDIIEAYARLGYLPPTHFSPPRFAGMRFTAKHQWLLACVRRSLRVQAGWAKSALRRVDEVAAWLKQNGEPRKAAA